MTTFPFNNGDRLRYVDDPSTDLVVVHNVPDDIGRIVVLDLGSRWYKLYDSRHLQGYEVVKPVLDQEVWLVWSVDGYFYTYSFKNDWGRGLIPFPSLVIHVDVDGVPTVVPTDENGYVE